MFPEILPLDVGTFTFPPDEPWPGEEGVVVAYAIRRREGVLLLDTGFARVRLVVGKGELADIERHDLRGGPPHGGEPAPSVRT